MTDASAKRWITALPPPQERAAYARAQLGTAIGFRDCRPELLDELVAMGSLRVLGRGEFLMRRGSKSEQAYLVVTGLLEASSLHLDGSRHLVGLLMPGDLAGVVSVIDAGPVIHDHLARHDSLVLGLPIPALRRLRDIESSLLRACEAQLAFRIRLLYGRLASDPGLPLKARVASVLLTMGQLYGLPLDGGEGALELRVSQTDLADWLGLSRQRVNFALKQLQAEGLIGLHYLAIRVLDVPALRACAEL